MTAFQDSTVAEVSPFGGADGDEARIDCATAESVTSEAILRAKEGHIPVVARELAAELHNLELDESEAIEFMELFVAAISTCVPEYCLGQAMATVRAVYSGPYFEGSEHLEPLDDGAFDSIRDYEVSPDETCEFGLPIPASKLGSGESPDWMWHGYIARGHVSLLTGLWKSGKTTLVTQILVDMAYGGNLAGEITPGKALVVTEESYGVWAERRNTRGLRDAVDFYSRPFKGRAHDQEWKMFIEHIVGLIKAEGYQLVIIDPIASILPISDENDSVSILNAVSPLHRITEAGAAVLLLHHPRKGDGAEGQASRGSGALTGFVDIIIEFRRTNPQSLRDTKRTISTLARFDECPREVVVDYVDDKYVSLGTPDDCSSAERSEKILGLLPADEPGLTPEELKRLWQEHYGTIAPTLRTLQMDLKDGHDSGKWRRSGRGVRGAPLRYFR